MDVGAARWARQDNGEAELSRSALGRGVRRSTRGVATLPWVLVSLLMAASLIFWPRLLIEVRVRKRPEGSRTAL